MQTEVILLAEKASHATAIILEGANWGTLCHQPSNVEATFLQYLFKAFCFTGLRGHFLWLSLELSMQVIHWNHSCYDPPQFFSSLSDPLLVTLPMPKRPLPLNPPILPDLPPLPPSEPSKPSSPLDQPPVEPLIPIPWNIHRREYSSMEGYQEPPPVENPLEDPDSPMEDMPSLEPEPVTHYGPDVPRGHTKTLSP